MFAQDYKVQFGGFSERGGGDLCLFIAQRGRPACYLLHKGGAPEVELCETNAEYQLVSVKKW